MGEWGKCEEGNGVFMVRLGLLFSWCFVLLVLCVEWRCKSKKNGGVNGGVNLSALLHPCKNAPAFVGILQKKLRTVQRHLKTLSVPFDPSISIISIISPKKLGQSLHIPKKNRTFATN